MGLIWTLKRVLGDNSAHLGRFFYLTAGSGLQIASLNFIVYPYLSRHLSESGFGELLLLMTLVNFCITVFGAAAVMMLYRRGAALKEDGGAEFMGRLLAVAAVLLFALAAIMTALYGYVADFWKLGAGRLGFFYLMCYMAFYALDMLLLVRLQIGYGFKEGFYTRVVFFLMCFLIIPAYFLAPGHWLASFILAPLASSVILLIMLRRNSMMVFKGKRPNMSGAGAEYSYFLMTTLASQLVIFSDRWILASFEIPLFEIAYFTVAMQACTLVMFPVERAGDLVMPSVANLASYDSLTRAQARKTVVAMLGSMAYALSAGFIVGYLFFSLYKPTYIENGWRYFAVMLVGTAMLPAYTFSRGYLVRFHPVRYIIFLNVAAFVLQAAITITLLSFESDAIWAAVGKVAGYAVVSALSLYLCQARIFRAAFKRAV